MACSNRNYIRANLHQGHRPDGLGPHTYAHAKRQHRPSDTSRFATMMQTEPSHVVQMTLRRLLDDTPKLEINATFPEAGPFEVQLPVWRPG